MLRKINFVRLLAGDAWVRPFLKRYRRSLIVALTLGVITFICGAALMFNSGYLISRAASLPENILIIYVPIVLTRAFGIGRPVFRYVERLVSHNWVLKMTSGLRLKLYQSLETQAVFLKSRYQTGDLLGLLSEDINHIQNLYLRTIFPTIIAWVLYVIVIIGLGVFSPFFALAMLLLLGVVAIVLPLWSVIINGARQERQKQLKNTLYRELTDNVLGVSDWIFSQQGARYLAHHENSQAALHQVDARLKRFNHFRDLILQLVFGVITICLLVWAGNYFPGNSGGPGNWIAAFVLAVFPLIDAFAPLPAAAQETNVYQDSVQRLNALPAVPETTDETVPTIETPIQLRVSHLAFQYEEETKQVLKDVNLDIHAGDKLAILGRSGSGKSTLAHLLRGDLTPTAGQVTLNGVAATALGDTISHYIGVIHQSPYLFNTTILNNLRLGREDASLDEVWQVLERVGLKTLVASLPSGLNTMVDSAGLRFSGGERHRLALARILLSRVPIIILDEPTVGLDPITEQRLLETFFTQLTDQTVIWITHHLQGVDLMDRVVFIEDGQLTMSGSPDELARSSAHYRELRRIDQGISG